MMRSVRVKFHLVSFFVDSCTDICDTVSKKYYTLIGQWLDDGSLKPNRVRLMPNGLESVEKGVRMLKNFEVHAEKLVYRIAETPQLKATA